MKYDLYKYQDNEIIEDTGLVKRELDYMSRLLENKEEGRPYFMMIFKSVTGSPSRESGEVLYFSESAFQANIKSGNLDPYSPGFHPLCREIGRMMKDEPGFFTALVEYLATIYRDLDNREKFEFSEVLRSILPEELKAKIRPRELCEGCVIKYQPLEETL